MWWWLVLLVQVRIAFARWRLADGRIDVIMSYSFGRSYKKLDKPDFDEDDYDATHVAASLAWVLKHFPFLLKMVKALPEFAQKSMGQALATFVTLQAVGF